MTGGTMQQYRRNVGPYDVQPADQRHLDGARGVMLDTFYRDFGYGYRPDWHRDVIDLDGSYLTPQHHALFVATKGDEVVGTTAVRAGGPKSPPHPRFLAQRYPDETTAQLFRVYVRPEHRRYGLARALVGLAVDFVTQQAHYRALYLHTDPRIDGAEPFWRSLATPIHDPRDGGDDIYQTVHFEIALPGRPR
ncbi:GNAT family N-acetyltransferase [Micromonospora sp. C51]|uniref:GNAT family N-acetyltransferase n=1 Tax=Micromonospora sp. C51 TaxID=2824879 RepID=UPI001B35ADA1|nr:GNAT family N-acetyltransferase [Micromonospora sp. C51]MBQ1047671.1 GNAT family N-acetyltransferase [Micromonospora sp. C51]